MGPNAEKLHKPLHNRESCNQDRKQTEYINSAYYEGETSEITCVDCLRYWSLKFLVNGMFTTSRIVGYSQFMVFMILRVIITGSLCGRLYGNDPDIKCIFNPNVNDVTTAGDSIEKDENFQVFNSSSINTSSIEVTTKCLYVAYSGVSPITLWALGLLTVALPWLLLLPWTPLSDDQDYVVCRHINVQWPCLTIYVVRFLKACIRLLLELSCLISVPAIYGSGIPNIVTCYDDNVICEVPGYKEKTYFLWLFMAVNVISSVLTICELVDICRNKQVYESEMGGGYSSVSKISSARSSTGTMNGQYTYRRQPTDVERGRSTSRGIYSRATSAAGSKKRFGLTRSADPESMPKDSKFRGRQPRPAECDDVIKMAAPTTGSQGSGGRSHPKLYYPVEGDKTLPKSATSSRISESSPQSNSVIISSAPDLEIHSSNNNDKPAAV